MTERKPLIIGGMFGAADVKTGTVQPEDRSKRMNSIFDEEEEEVQPPKPTKGLGGISE